MGAIDAHHGSDIQAFIRSLKRIRDSDVEWLLPSHGPIFRKDNALLESTIERSNGYLHMADFGTCAVDWPLMDEWDEELAQRGRSHEGLNTGTLSPTSGCVRDRVRLHHWVRLCDRSVPAQSGGIAKNARHVPRRRGRPKCNSRFSFLRRDLYVGPTFSGSGRGIVRRNCARARFLGLDHCGEIQSQGRRRPSRAKDSKGSWELTANHIAWTTTSLPKCL